jgi:hypothetical protein
MDSADWFLILAGLLSGYGAYRIGFTTWDYYFRFGIAFAILAGAMADTMLFGRSRLWGWSWSFGAVLLYLAIWRPKPRKSIFF